VRARRTYPDGIAPTYVRRTLANADFTSRPRKAIGTISQQLSNFGLGPIKDSGIATEGETPQLSIQTVAKRVSPRQFRTLITVTVR